MPFDITPHIPSLDITDFLIIGFSLAVLMCRLLYIMVFYGRLAFRRVTPAGTSSLPITILVTERNEEERLSKNLPAWLKLGYPAYEMLVVDDFSEDNTMATLALLRNTSQRLKFTSLSQETRYSEKMARNIGLKAASHDLVVLAHPAMVCPDNHWLPGISAAVAAGNDVVIGYSNLLPDKGFRNKLYRAESFIRQMESMAFSITGFPFVTAEENVTFKKPDYFEAGGFAGKIREEYLNLEMIVNSIIKRSKVDILPAGNLSLRKEADIDRIALRDLFNKSFRLMQHMRGGTRFIVQFTRTTGMLTIPVLALLLFLYPWTIAYAGGFLLLNAILYLLIINRLLKRFHEPELFVFSSLYAIVAPYWRSIAQWRFTQSRKRRR